MCRVYYRWKAEGNAPSFKKPSAPVWKKRFPGLGKEVRAATKAHKAPTNAQVYLGARSFNGLQAYQASFLSIRFCGAAPDASPTIKPVCGEIAPSRQQIILRLSGKCSAPRRARIGRNVSLTP